VNDRVTRRDVCSSSEPFDRVVSFAEALVLKMDPELREDGRDGRRRISHAREAT